MLSPAQTHTNSSVEPSQGLKEGLRGLRRFLILLTGVHQGYQTYDEGRRRIKGEEGEVGDDKR